MNLAQPRVADRRSCNTRELRNGVIVLKTRNRSRRAELESNLGITVVSGPARWTLDWLPLPVGPSPTLPPPPDSADTSLNSPPLTSTLGAYHYQFSKDKEYLLDQALLQGVIEYFDKFNRIIFQFFIRNLWTCLSKPHETRDNVLLVWSG